MRGGALVTACATSAPLFAVVQLECIRDRVLFHSRDTGRAHSDRREELDAPCPKPLQKNPNYIRTAATGVHA